MKETGSKIPAEFWKTTAGQPLCNAMHSNAWEGLDCLNAQINALTAASENTADATIKAELEKAKAKVISARAACRKAMAILSDSTSSDHFIIKARKGNEEDIKSRLLQFQPIPINNIAFSQSGMPIVWGDC